MEIGANKGGGGDGFQRFLANAMKNFHIFCEPFPNLIGK